VLEYLLARMNQEDIYKRYLKAVSFCLTPYGGVAVANVAVGLVLRGGVTPSRATGVATALASPSLFRYDAMTFSSLQKQRQDKSTISLAWGLLVLPAYLLRSF